MIRKAAVAGYFYNGNDRELGREIFEMTRSDLETRAIVGAITPHAGFKYSGHTAGLLYGSTTLPKRFVILGPKHRAGGARMAYQASGSWETPLGEYPIDEELATALKDGCIGLEDDPVPHKIEHSIEVQIPFLQKKQPEGAFVPIALGHLEWHQVELLGRSIAAVMETLEGDKPLLLASSDLNHYDDEATTLEKDERALEKVLALDAKGLLDTCAGYGVSMCGVIPSAVMLVAAKVLGATEAEILEHTTSARASGDTSRTVGYAAVQVY